MRSRWSSSRGVELKRPRPRARKAFVPFCPICSTARCRRFPRTTGGSRGAGRGQGTGGSCQGANDYILITDNCTLTTTMDKRDFIQRALTVWLPQLELCEVNYGPRARRIGIPNLKVRTSVSSRILKQTAVRRCGTRRHRCRWPTRAWRTGTPVGCARPGYATSL